MDDPLSTTGNHLTREIKAAFCDAITAQNGQEQIDRVPKIYHGAAGLGSRDVRPGDIYAIFENMIEDGAGLSSRSASSTPRPCRCARIPTCVRRARFRCAATRSAASAR